MINYSRLKWHSNFNSKEIISEIEEDYVVSLYSIIDFPDVTLYIDTEKDIILEVFLEK